MESRKLKIRMLAATMSGILILGTGTPLTQVKAQETASEAVSVVTEENLKEAEADLVITSAREMKEFAQNPNAYKVVKLGNDIAFDGVTVNNYTPISGFKGIFDGCGYIISGIDVTKPSSDVGLFVSLDGATIKNVTVKNSNFTGRHAGAIVADGKGTIMNCKTDGTVTIAGSYSAGGIAGYLDGEIRNCFSAGSVTLHLGSTGSSGYGAGGIVGGCGLWSSSLLTSIYNSANIGKVDVSCENSRADGGGIAGYAANIQNCYNAGVVTADDNSAAGGIAYSLRGVAANNFYSEESAEVGIFSIRTGAVSKNNKALPLGQMQTADFASQLNTNRGDNTEWIAWELRDSSAYPQHVPLIRITDAQIALSAETFTYDGTEKTPVVTVTYNGNTLVREQDYTLLYENMIEVGTATVTIEGAGRYVDSVTRSYTIIPAPPKKGTVLKSGKVSYKVTKAGSEVAYVGTTATAKKITVPATVEIDGFTYKVTSIAASAFKGNKKVTTVAIGNNVTTIGTNAFNGCKKLKTVTIGTGLKTIGNKAFYDCSVLKTITIKSMQLKKVGANALKGINGTAKIKVPSKKLASYKKLLKGKGQGSKVKITKN